MDPDATIAWTRLRRADRIALLIVGAVTVLCLMIGFGPGRTTHDVDEVVYEHTLTAMHHGAGYYPAMRAALVEKEGAPPSQIRSVRPPTLFLVLHKLPAAGWRWAAGAVFLTTMLLAWRVGRPLAAYGGPLAAGIAGVWATSLATVTYLHAEVWGLPFLLGGLLAMRRSRWAVAAACLVAATLFRETYAIAFVFGLVFAKDRRWWWRGLGALVGAGAAHAVLASQILVADGREAPFGASGLSPRYVLSAVSPGTEPAYWILGVVTGALGVVALRSRWDTDAAARTLLCFAAVMAPATILIGRMYWSVTFAPAVAVFAPAAVDWFAARESGER